MTTPDNTPTRKQRAVCPDGLKNRTYFKFADGQEKVIDKVAYSVYPAKDKETSEILKSKAGNTIFNTTAYVGFTDGTYSTVKNEVAISQLIGITGDFPNEGGVYEYDVPECPVKIGTKNIKYGNKEYPSWVFYPM